MTSVACAGGLVEALDATAGIDGRLGLSFEIVYGHAFKPIPGVRASGETAVSLERMRSMLRAPGGTRT